RADRNAQNRGEGGHVHPMTRRGDDAGQAREHHKRHHPGLEQRQEVTDRGDPGRGICVDKRHYLIFGSSLNWWKGGGDGRVHSSVVAPTPQGLSPAIRLAMKASASITRKMMTPNPAMKAPIEE